MKKILMVFSVLAVLSFFAAGNITAVELGGVDIHGFVSQGYMYTTENVEFMVPETDEGSFEFTEMGVNFSCRPADYLSSMPEDLSIGAQFLAFDFGNVGDNKVKVDWAYGDYAFQDYLGLRAGIMKVPHGLYNETRKIDMLRTSILLPTSVYPEWLREAMSRVEGFGVYGTLLNSVSYQAQYGHVSLDSDGGLAKAFATLISDFTVTDIDTDEAYSAALQWDTPLPGLKFGATAIYLNINQIDMIGNNSRQIPIPVYGGTPPAPTGAFVMTPMQMEATLKTEPIETFVLSGEYQRDRLTIAAEYVQYEVEFDMDINTSSDTNYIQQMAALGDPGSIELTTYLNTLHHRETTMEGYYGQISYRLLDNLEVGAYYSELYWDKEDRNGSEYAENYNKPRYGGYVKDTCLSLRYDFSTNWCAKVEAHVMNGTLFALNNPDDHWEMYMGKLSYLF